MKVNMGWAGEQTERRRKGGRRRRGHDEEKMVGASGSGIDWR